MTFKSFAIFFNLHLHAPVFVFKCLPDQFTFENMSILITDHILSSTSVKSKYKIFNKHWRISKKTSSRILMNHNEFGLIVKEKNYLKSLSNFYWIPKEYLRFTFKISNLPKLFRGYNHRKEAFTWIQKTRNYGLDHSFLEQSESQASRIK